MNSSDNRYYKSLKTCSVYLTLHFSEKSFVSLHPTYVVVSRCHLQVLRHLYVLAVEPRLITPVDVDTMEACYVPVEITLKVRAEKFDIFCLAPRLLYVLFKIFLYILLDAVQTVLHSFLHTFYESTNIFLLILFHIFRQLLPYLACPEIFPLKLLSYFLCFTCVVHSLLVSIYLSPDD